MNPADVVAFHEDHDHTHALSASGGGKPGQGYQAVTPVECERLQGFPDHWTAIDGEATPDGKRYAALGDAVTVNVAQWVAERLVRFG